MIWNLKKPQIWRQPPIWKWPQIWRRPQKLGQPKIWRKPDMWGWSQTWQTKPIIPKLPTKSVKLNLPKWAKHTKLNLSKQKKHQKFFHGPNWQIKTMLVDQSKQGSNQSQTSLSLPWACHSSAPSCLPFLFRCLPTDKLSFLYCYSTYSATCSVEAHTPIIIILLLDSFCQLIRFILHEPLKHITSYLVEPLWQKTHHFPEPFQQITSYLPELIHRSNV